MNDFPVQRTYEQLCDADLELACTALGAELDRLREMEEAARIARAGVMNVLKERRGHGYIQAHQDS